MTSIKVVSLGAVAALAMLSFGKEQTPPPQPVAHQPQSKTVECRWASGTIKFDGVINERIWAEAEVVELHVPWERRLAKTATKARLTWDREYLYFATEMEDHDLYADLPDANGKHWDIDSFALYFKPHGNKLGYYEFQVSAANVCSQIYFPSRGAGGYHRFGAQKPTDIEVAVKHRGTLNDWTDKDKGWTIEGRIAWSAFAPTGGKPRPGDRWHFALCRRDFSVTLDRPELSTSAALTVPDFHRYEEYQDLVFMGRQ